MAALETGGPSGAIRGLTSVYFNATVCALVCVGGWWGGHEGLRLLIFPLAVLEPCVFFFFEASHLTQFLEKPNTVCAPRC